MKKFITPAIAIYSIILIVEAFVNGVKGGGAVNLLPLSGTIAAVFMYLNRYESEEYNKRAFKCAMGIVAVSAVASIVISFFGKNILTNILYNIAGCVTMLSLVALFSKKLTYVRECSKKTFIISLAVALLVAPSVLNIFQGVLVFLLSIVIIIAASTMLFSNLGGFMEACQSKNTKMFVDKMGVSHMTGLDRDKANERYDESHNS